MLGYTYCQVFQSKLYGFLFCVPIIYVGCLLGALMSFLISRYLFKDVIKNMIQESAWLNYNFKMIDEIIKSEGIKVVGLVRLTFAPFGITSYIVGVTSISLGDYMLGNLSYIINCCTQVFIGCSLYTAVTPHHKHNLELNSDKTLTRLTFVLEICFTIIVTIVIGYLAKNILEKKLKEKEELAKEKHNGIMIEPNRYLARTHY